MSQEDLSATRATRDSPDHTKSREDLLYEVQNLRAQLVAEREMNADAPDAQAKFAQRQNHPVGPIGSALRQRPQTVT